MQYNFILFILLLTFPRPKLLPYMPILKNIFKKIHFLLLIYMWLSAGQWSTDYGLPSPNIYLLSIAPGLWVGFVSFPCCVGIWFGLNLHSRCACCHNHCEFVCANCLAFSRRLFPCGYLLCLLLHSFHYFINNGPCVLEVYDMHILLEMFSHLAFDYLVAMPFFGGGHF